MKIAIQTPCKIKFGEFYKALDRHNAEIVHTDIAGWVGEEGIPQSVKCQFEKDKDLEFVLRERTLLKDSKGIDTSNPKQLQVLINTSILEVFYLGKTGEIQKDIFEGSMKGYCDKSKGIIVGSQKPFGWDGIFVDHQTGITLHNMKLSGLKLSARQKAIAYFINRYLYNKQRKDLHNQTIFPDSSLEFIKGSFQIRSNPYFKNDAIDTYGVRQMLYTACNNGIFLILPQNNREEKIAMTPGIAVEPNNSDFLETLSIMRNTIRHILPELLLDGIPGNDKDVYVKYNLSRDAISCVISDMLFLDSLHSVGFEIQKADTGPHELFMILKKQNDFQDRNTLIKLHSAAIMYFVFGNPKGFIGLGAREEEMHSLLGCKKMYFNERKQEFGKEFIYISEQIQLLQKWKYSVRTLLKGDNIEKDNDIWLSNFLEHISDNDGIHNFCLKRIEENFNNPIELKDEQVVKAGFFRYVIRQLAIFSRFDFESQAKTYLENIIDQMGRNDGSIEIIELIREYYNLFIDYLKSRNFIDEDGAKSSKEFFNFL